MTDTTMLIAGAQADATAWKARAEAAEARCARLEGALCDAIIIAEETHTRPELIRRWLAILSDTAEEKTGDD